MPQLKPAAKSVDTPLVNPPTPFRSTSGQNENLPKLIFETDSDSSSEEVSPQSVISPATAPTYPSVMPTESVSEAALNDELLDPVEPDLRSDPNPPKVPKPPNLQIVLDQMSFKNSTADKNEPPSTIDPPTFRSDVDNETSLASSLQQSVTIRTNDSVSIETQESVVKLKVSTPNKADEAQKLEAAVCSLALRQEAEIRKLLEQQERDRELLKAMFEEQRRQLIEEIMVQVRSGQQSRFVPFKVIVKYD